MKKATRKTQRTYCITGPEGELGEGTGATKEEALLNLYYTAMKDPVFARRVSGVHLAYNGKALRFTGKGPFPPNVDAVTFERVA